MLMVRLLVDSRHASRCWCCNLQNLGNVRPFDTVSGTPKGTTYAYLSGDGRHASTPTMLLKVAPGTLPLPSYVCVCGCWVFVLSLSL
jgi:hypothetical protein